MWEGTLATVSRKKVFAVDATPKKRIFLSIISDYDLKTGICELVDNAIDGWVSNGKQPGLAISIVLDASRQVILVRDNAGGVREEDAELLVAPGASRDAAGHSLIGIFGVGGKRAAVALGEHVEIRTRHLEGKGIGLDLTTEWINTPGWGI